MSGSFFVYNSKLVQFEDTYQFVATYYVNDRHEKVKIIRFKKGLKIPKIVYTHVFF